jgi:3-dehydrosphinganine reductase
MRRLFRRFLQHLRRALMKTYHLALVTGGSSGIGFALAKLLAAEGTHVCLLARDEEKLAMAEVDLQKLKTHPDQVIETISCDITDYQNLDKKLKQWVDRSGSPDLVVNSAGITYPGYFQELDVDIFHQLMDVNYYGTLHVIKSLVNGMIERGSGTIVNLSSQAGFIGVFGYSGYSASKHAVRGLSDVLLAELKPIGIQVSIVFPADTKTPQLEFEEPLKPFETKEIAGMANVMTAEAVAEGILKDVKKGKYIILPGFDAKFFYRLGLTIGNLRYPYMAYLVRKAKKKKEKQLKENQNQQ